MGVLKALNQGIIGVLCVSLFSIFAYFLDAPYALLVVTIIGFGYFIALHYPYLLAVSKEFNITLRLKDTTYLLISYAFG